MQNSVCVRRYAQFGPTLRDDVANYEETHKKGAHPLLSGNRVERPDP